MKITAENVFDLTPAAQKAMLLQMLDKIKKEVEQDDEDDSFIPSVLGDLIHLCDCYDEMDAFGTEGWRHSFGFDD